MPSHPSPYGARAHPTRIGRYTVVRPLSKGGMAYVYEGRRETLEGVNPRVAIKVILPEHQTSETFRELFVNEAKLGASMQHQNLVQFQDFGREGHTWYIVMEYVEGLTLRKILGQCERHAITMPLQVIAEIGRQACNGLHYAHTATDAQERPLRLIHRDIKPSNLILNPHGIVKVLDFGISKGVLREERKGSVKGTWGYMAPEQAEGLDVGPQADVFGLATVLYELAARRPMFTDQPKEEVKRLLFDDHAARMVAMLDGKLYGRLIGVLIRALQRDPAARYPTARAFGVALGELLTDPVTDRDRLMAFYERMVDPSRAVLQTMAAPSGNDDVALVPITPPSVPARPPPGGSVGWLSFVAGAAVSVVLTMALLGAAAWAIAFIAQQRFPAGDPSVVEAEPSVPVAPAVPLARDEPAGPAGVGAPGEDRPRPVDSRRVRAARGAAVPAPAVQAVPAPAQRPPVAPPPTPEVPAPGPDPVAPLPPGHGVLVLGCEERAEVFVSDRYIGQTPLEHAVPSGTYTVRLELEDGRKKSFSLTVASGKEIRRVWDFENLEWRVDLERERAVD